MCFPFSASLSGSFFATLADSYQACLKKMMISISTFILVWNNSQFMERQNQFSLQVSFLLLWRGEFLLGWNSFQSARASFPTTLTVFGDVCAFSYGALNGRIQGDCIPHIFTVNRVTAAGLDCTAASLWCVFVRLLGQVYVCKCMVRCVCVCVCVCVCWQWTDLLSAGWEKGFMYKLKGSEHQNNRSFCFSVYIS